MKANRKFIKFIILTIFGISFLLPAVEGLGDALASLTLIDFSQGYNIDLAPKRAVNATITDTGALHVETDMSQSHPGIVLKAPNGKWDLSKYREVSVSVKNVGTNKGTLCCRLDDYPEVRKKGALRSGCLSLESNTSGVIRIPLINATHLKKSIQFIGMRQNPLDTLDFDPSKVEKIVFYNLFTPVPKQKHAFEVSSIQAEGIFEPFSPANAENFFPMIDEFGQYIHKEWATKIHTVDELLAWITEEKKDLLAHPGATDRNKYGGWSKGPKLKATGFFRVEKYKEKWWLVDPEGRLFWSNGINVINTGEDTPVTDREYYFAELPDESSPFAKLYRWRSGTPSDYYQRYNQIKTYNFMTANLMRKYGKNWQQNFTDRTFQRLHSWGINTVGNWSSPEMYSRREMPYVKTIAHKAKIIQSPWNPKVKIYDVFDPSFRSGLAKSLAREIGKSANDPWCIGYFVDNEPKLGDKIDTATVETYFRIIREEIKKIAPNQLYLGCRFLNYNDRIIQAAAKYCDVISFNIYKYNVEKSPLPVDIDMPVIIGEFHFGTLDSGMFWEGLKKAIDQKHRGEQYARYMYSALQNPNYIGAHWFQYWDEPTTGRFDGENGQVGFIDTCDTPYSEFIESVRQVGHAMYNYRMFANSKTSSLYGLERVEDLHVKSLIVVPKREK